MKLQKKSLPISSIISLRNHKRFLGSKFSKMKKNTKNVPNLTSDNLEDGVHTVYRENGQKHYEWTTKNGEWDGLMTWWYKNGQKNSETIYKDGYEFSLKRV